MENCKDMCSSNFRHRSTMGLGIGVGKGKKMEGLVPIVAHGLDKNKKDKMGHRK